MGNTKTRVKVREGWYEMRPTHVFGHATRAHSGTSECGHFVENVNADPDFCFLVVEAPGFQFRPDDSLPSTHLCFYATPFVVNWVQAYIRLAYSPEARGRSELMFGTLQKRLPQELRLNGITTMEEANRFLTEECVMS